MNRRFLIAHPDPDVVSRLESALREDHRSAHVVHDGLDAIDRALDSKPDAVILGVNLPGLSGLDVARALRAVEPTKNIPILFVAGDSEEATSIAHAGLPHVACLVGPVDAESLRGELAQLFRPNHPEHDPLSRHLDNHPGETTDPVTGLHSRHYMLHRLAYEAARAARYKLPMACLLFRVQNLDLVTELIGEEAVNQVLAQIADLLRQSTRATDTLGRGEKCEFVMIAWRTDESGARRIAERLQGVFTAQRYELEPPHDRADVAIGYAAVTESNLSDNLALLARAEGALVRAEADPSNPVMGG